MQAKSFATSLMGRKIAGLPQGGTITRARPQRSAGPEARRDSPDLAKTAKDFCAQRV